MSTHAQVEVLRLQAKQLFADGKSLAEVATAVGRSKRTVYVWLKAHRAGGDEALKRKMNTGRSLGLTKAQWRRLGRALERKPAAAGVKATKWNPSVFAGLVTRVSRKPCNRFMARRIMKEFGYRRGPTEVNLGWKNPRRAGRWEKQQ